MGKTKQDVLSEFRCGEILEAARKVFGRKGFNEATVDEIAEEAGLAKGTVYLYFPSKREMYLAALRRGLAGLFETTMRNVAAAATIEDKIRAFIATRVNYAEQNRDLFKIYHSEFGNIVHPAYVNKDLKDLYVRQAKALEAVLREAARAGTIRMSRPETAAFIIYDMTRGLMTQRLLGWSKAEVEEDIGFLFELVWRGLQG